MPTNSTRRPRKRRAPAKGIAREPRLRVSVQRMVRGAPATGRLRAAALAAARPGAQLTLRVVGAAEARALNRGYRGCDYAANVLSFAYGARAGDIVLCHPVIAREASAQRKPLAAHYAHLVVHGVLHVHGFAHDRPRDAARMEREESRILARLGHPNPYAVE